MLLNQGLVNSRKQEDSNESYSKLIAISQLNSQTQLDVTKRKRVQLAKDLLKVIECDTKTSTSEELVGIVRRTLPRDYFQTYLLARIHNKFNEPEQEKAALSEIDEDRNRTYRLFALMICSTFASSLLFVTNFFLKKKIWDLPAPETLSMCPHPYGWFKPAVISLLSGGITCLLIVALWIQCPPLVVVGGVPLASTFMPDKVSMLEAAHQLVTTVPFILWTFLCVHQSSAFAEFVRLKFQSNGYTKPQLLSLGVAGFSISWMLANTSMLLSMWYHYPGDTAVTVGTGLIAGSHSPLAILFLFAGTAIFAPITEEIIFRGILNPALRRHLDAKTVMLLGSLVFAVAHLEFTPWWFIHKFFLGYINSYLLEKTGSIVPGIVNHMLLNTFVVLFLCICS